LFSLLQHEAINGKGKNKLELVTYLCEHGCNTNIPGMDNEFALHEAARNGLEEIVKCLLSHSASPNVRNKLGKLPRYAQQIYK
jgi:ankyrin repeat protein